MSTLRSLIASKARKPWATEVAEQFDWNLPDAIFYPTGGGVA